MQFIYLIVRILKNWGTSQMITPDIRKMTQAEFDNFMADLKVNNPNLFQFVADFINKKVTVQEVEAFQKMEHQAQQLYIKNYKARA